MGIITGLAAFGFVFQIGTQNVPVGDDINYSNNGPLFNITHAPGEEGITVELAGVYDISFGIYTSQNNPQDWAVAVNDAIVAEFNGAGQTIVAAVTLDLNAGDIVTIRNVATGGAEGATLREEDTISSWVKINKLD
ncbi:hypothetical protein SPSYN_01434 [Sporotomaculum syntrophicum]|uniref:Uncharacterized protein n=1 Tax=Sporotomaculum syntrophicum TaxID=182264 RepID=A0A9D2WQ44_9FIRM|nr:hypothetical protein [Sporotomaculum syntrophicum]KAF1085298.1 hypothetical protein SPSYN_01434 [Sporotomaculum syntrophicum]